MKGAGISLQTYYTYRKKLENGDTLDPKPLDRHAPKFTPEVRRSIGQLLAQNPERSSAELSMKLYRRFGRRFSSSGVRMVLRSMGHHVGVSQPRLLTPENKRLRLRYAQSHLQTDWHRLTSYDECYFNLWKSNHRVRYNFRTNSRKAFRPLSNSQESVSIGISAAISRNRKSAICFLPKNWHVENMTNVWEEELLPSLDWDPSLRRCRSFIIDNDGRHHSHELNVTAGLHQLNRDGCLPSNSPDLNPIENVWNIMKQHILRQHPTNYNELRQAILDAWELVTPDVLRKLFDSMPSRIQAVIDNKGDRTDYWMW